MKFLLVLLNMQAFIFTPDATAARAGARLGLRYRLAANRLVRTHDLLLRRLNKYFLLVSLYVPKSYHGRNYVYRKSMENHGIDVF